MNPRKPTQGEKEQFIQYLHANGYDSEYIDKWYMAVFDTYQTDYPGYSGKVLLVLPTYDLYPSIVEIYVWDEGKITRVRNEEGMKRIVDKNLEVQKK